MRLRSTRYLIGLAHVVQVGLLLALAGFSYWGIGHMSRTEDHEFYESIAQIEAASQLEIAAERVVIRVRGMLLGAPIVPADQLFKDYDAALERLTHNPQAHPDPRLLAEIHALGQEYRAYATRIRELMQAGRRDEAVAVFNGGGFLARNHWIDRLEALLDFERGEANRYHDQVNATEDLVKGVVSSVALLAIPLGLLMAAMISRRVVAPLRVLEGAVHEMAGGRFEVRVPALYDDEFGRVATGFNLMASRVEEAVTSLENANEALVALDISKDEFLSVASHELKTPLSAIKGFASLLESQHGQVLPPDGRTYLANIGQAADRLARLVNDLLDLTSIRLGKLALAPQACDVGLLVEDVLESMGPLALARGITLAADLQARPTVALDYDRMGQVLTNLVGNAIKFTPPGGRVDVVTSRDGAGLRMEVRDTGPGIPAQDFSRLFRPFSQLDMGSTRAAGGTGLGLAISKALVEGHHGTIGLTSTPGAGSTFWFTLPLA
ncbi:MAG: integral rane sensor hybrid histidine kinase [Cyanobacteria bacterium RYN_339]|nr:integral rane sensor hybrid histidine kinase [Cyanobacteria bacterium RYN_339]